MSAIESEKASGQATDTTDPSTRQACTSAHSIDTPDAVEPHLGETAPLSPWQHGIWLFDQLHRTSPAYNIPYRLHLDGKLDAAALERSIREIFRRHTVLRSQVGLESGEPTQRILPVEQIALPWFDFGELAVAAREQRYRELAEAVAFQPFDLQTGPFARVTLVRLTSTKHAILATFHHIAADGSSVSLFFDELNALYNAFAAGLPSPLPEPSIQYRDYAAWQQARAQTPATEVDVEYWAEQLAAAPPLLEIPTDRPRQTHPNHAAATAAVIVPKRTIDALRSLAHAAGATLFMVMLAAFQVLLARLSGADDVVTGIPIAGRDIPETEILIGCFINVLPLRSRMGLDTTFMKLLGSVRSAVLASHAHQQLPFPLLVEHLHPERSASYLPVTQVLFNYDCNIQPPPLDFLDLRADLERVAQTSSVDQFGMDVTRSGDDIRCGVLYRTELFDDATIARWLGHYRTLLEGIVTTPNSTIGQLPLLTTNERARMLAGFSRPSTAVVDCDQCIHVLVELQALRSPDAVAVVLDHDTLTYAQLDRRANALAYKLRDLGVGPDTLVGVCLEKSPQLIIAILAVLKAGGGYLPLDPALPQARLAHIIADSGANAFIADDSTADLMPVAETQMLRLNARNDGEEAPEAPDSEVTARNIAYVIYTSGSTGQPKGVAIEHGSLCNHLLHGQAAFALHAADLILVRTSIGFDISIKEIFWPLIAGARLVLARPGNEADPGYLVSLIEARRITILMCVPTLLTALLEQPQVQTRCASLRRISCGGEIMPLSLARQCLSLFPGVPLLNGYGPTEVTISCTAWTCNGAERHAIPIGHSIAGAELYVLDRQLEPVPLGVTGELYVGGAGVARGYIRLPELTRERFMPNPFLPHAGERLYRTGDLVRRRADGALDFLGRNDDQVKIRGVRIELGEIEAALSTHPDVSACAAAVCRNASGNPQLVGYVVPRNGTRVDIHALRPFLARQLPDAMVPPCFVAIDAIPLTSSGKVNRAALPTPDTRLAHGESLHASDPLQDELIRIWEEVLEVAPIGITDNFFDLGGHSLLAVTMLERVASTFGVKPPLHALFEEPTVRNLAASIIDAGREQVAENDAPIWCIQTGARARTPLFLFHGDIAGGGLYCRKLLKYLDRRLPVYILPPRTTGTPQTVEAMAEDALLHIESAWKGPYLLAGYCNGGLVAFEAARRLRTQGKNVALLAVINLGIANTRLKFLHRTVHVVSKVFRVNPVRRDRIFLRLREPLLRFHTERSSIGKTLGGALFVPLAASEFAARSALRRVCRAPLRWLGSPGRGTAQNASDEIRRALPDWKSRRERLDYMGRAMAIYMPRFYRGPITVILSQADAAKYHDDPFHSWRSIATSVDGWIVEGNHFSVVTEHISALAEILCKYLSDAGDPGNVANSSEE